MNSYVLLDVAFDLNDDGTADLFMGDLKKRQKLLEEQYPDTTIKNANLTILDQDGHLFPYLVKLEQRKNLGDAPIAVNKIIFAGNEQPSAAETIVLLTGTCHNARTLENPLAFFHSLLSSERVEA